MSLFHASTCFEHTYSSSGGQNCNIQHPVHGTATYRCDDTRGCIAQFWPPDDEYVCSKHVEAWNKLIIKFSASSWLVLRNRYIEMHGQRNIKISSKVFFSEVCALYPCCPGAVWPQVSHDGPSLPSHFCANHWISLVTTSTCRFHAEWLNVFFSST
jgi:hypothetical protein